MDRNGSRLFRIHTHHPRESRYFPDPDAVEPMDPPRFLIGDLPAELREKYVAEGEPDTFDELHELGIESLVWRKPLRHLEYEWVSQDVFDVWRQLAPNVESIRSFVFLDGGPERRYHAVGSKQWPPAGRTARGQRDHYWILNEDGERLLEPGQNLAGYLKNRTDPLTIFYPSWLDRDDVMMWLGHPMAVTEGFVERWKNSEISKMLQAADFETDLAFVETNGQLTGYRPTDRVKVEFQWLDVPQPDDIDGFDATRGGFSDAASR